MATTDMKPPALYINTHAVDPQASSTFYQALSFTPVPAYSDASTTQCLLLPSPNDSICLFLHSRDRIRDFLRPGTGPNDAHASTETLLALSCDSRAQVDDWLRRAVEAGGQADPFVVEGHGAKHGMYSRSFADLDGHIWEVLCYLPQPEGS